MRYRDGKFLAPGRLTGDTFLQTVEAGYQASTTPGVNGPQPSPAKFQYFGSEGTGTKCPTLDKGRYATHLFDSPETWHVTGGFRGDNVSMPTIPYSANKSLFIILLRTAVGRHSTCS
jgi:hypothetical protein